jgi:small acid-soluble spore protein D (minor alpha/beta-type SASP)
MGRRKNRLLVPSAKTAIDQLRDQVVAEKAREFARNPSVQHANRSEPMNGMASHSASLKATPSRSQDKDELDASEVILPYPLSMRSKPDEGVRSMKNAEEIKPASQPSNPMSRLAESLGIPYRRGDNGDLKAKQAGALGGAIGGEMVRRLIAVAEQQLQAKQSQNDLR